MKKLLVIATALILTIASCDNKSLKQSEVPASVISGFTTKYPGATDAKWKKEKSDGKEIYEAAFKQNGKEVEAEFLPDGTFYKED